MKADQIINARTKAIFNLVSHRFHSARYTYGVNELGVRFPGKDRQH